MVSGSISLLCSRFFSPFLHSTGSLSVSREYLALRDGPRGFIQDFSCPALLRCRLGFASDSSTGLSPSLIQLSNWFDFLRSCLYWRSFYPDPAETGTVWAIPRSLATTCGITFVFFSYGYLDVSVPHVRLPYGMTGLLPAGLPHSEIYGSADICSLP